MKNGKVILGVAAAIVTVGSGLAFKAAHKFRTVKVYGKTALGNVCQQCKSLWTTNSAVHATKCKTIGGVATLHGFGSGAIRTFYTQTNTSHLCTGGHTTKVTKTS